LRTRTRADWAMNSTILHFAGVNRFSFPASTHHRLGST
jgi:hypothetical protein